MSFILDALRKSEHERQRQSGPDIAPLHTAPQRPAIPAWGIAVAALLAVNVAVVLVLVLRGGEKQTTATSMDSAAIAVAPVAAASQPLAPPPISPAPAVENTQQVSPTPTNLPQPAPVSAAPYPLPEPHTPADPILTEEETNDRLPSIHELNFQGANALPQLHLDIHVYANKPKDRFVFINMNKYKEGAQTAEGILIERITPDGVILNRNGTRFTLPRQ